MMKANYKKIIIWVVVVVIIMALSVFYLRYQEDKKYERQGAELVNKIEAFKKEHHRLPNSFSELGLEEPMGTGPYYEKMDSLNYIVYFNIGFDDTKVYYSKSKEWKNERQ